MSPIRLAISGTSNCGKTTLAEDLANTLGVPVIPEFHGSPFEATAGLKPAREMKRFTAILEAKAAREAELPDGFVSDRCPIDLAYSWLIRALPISFPEQSKAFFDRCRELAQAYDAIIFPPGPSLDPGGSSFYGNPKRFWEMCRNHSALIGLAYQWCPHEKVFHIPATQQTREQRTQWVIDHCPPVG